MIGFLLYFIKILFCFLSMSKYTIRNLEETDYKLGYMDCINELTEPVNVAEKDFINRLKFLRNKQDYHSIVVVDDQSGLIVGCGTLFLEYKFIKGLVTKGHIEDVVVKEDKRGSGIGTLIINHLISIAKEKNCYKISLVCNRDNVKFYKKCGFQEKEVEMVKYT